MAMAVEILIWAQSLALLVLQFQAVSSFIQLVEIVNRLSEN